MSEPIDYSGGANDMKEERAQVTRRGAPVVWPAVVLVCALWAYRFVAARLEMTMFEKFMGLMGLQALVVLLFIVWWWVGWRVRMSWLERLWGFFGIVVVMIACERLAHPSMQKMTWFIMVTPVALSVWAGWFLLARKGRPILRTGGAVAAVLVAGLVYDMLRMEGLSGEQNVELAARWGRSKEQIYLAELAKSGGPATRPMDAAAIVMREDDWPGFRGAQRDGVVRGLKIATDWNGRPTKMLWKVRVGPGWSSPTVVGERVYTQEQRGTKEVVVCRDASDGREVWVHEDAVRFEEGMSGAGPRATPTFVDGKLYTLGATGMLNCLDATSGAVVWRADITEGGVKPPIWGFASSPVVSGGMVVVYVGGSKGLVGYRRDSGKFAWSAASGEQSYVSPQLAKIGGREQVLFMSDEAVIGVDPGTGAVLWQYPMAAKGAPRSIQPHPVSDSLVTVSSETDLGTALLEVTPSSGGYAVDRKWVSRALKPSFNDFVVCDGLAYGFDGAVFCCTDLKDGKRKWREGRYGHGQVVLLEDQKLLLILSEEGEVVLVRASPDRSEELGRFKAIEGKTWNHPAVARGKLVVRNGEEMAGFELK